MPHSWQTPTTNRTSSSHYNFGDLNRVDNNTNYIVEYLTTWLATYAHCIPSGVIATPPSITAYTDKTIDDILKPSELNEAESNIESIKSDLGAPVGWLTSITDWAAYDAFVYTDANRLESNLSLLKTSAETLKDRLDRIDQALLYCGTFNTGQGNEGIF